MNAFEYGKALDFRSPEKLRNNERSFSINKKVNEFKKKVFDQE